jgi:hypothetical protein
VIARGEIDGHQWERLATSGLHLPEPKRPRGLRIEDIKVGRRGKLAFISARVLDHTNIAYPREGTRVGVRVGNGDGRSRDLSMRYSYHTKRYHVASALPLGQHHLEVHADQKGDHAEQIVDINL